MASQTKPTKAQLPHVLMGEFQRLYKERYGTSLTINRYKYKWAFAEIIDEFGYDDAYALVEYYFTLESPRGHKIEHFLNNYDRVLLMKKEREADKAEIARLLKQTQERIESES